MRECVLICIDTPCFVARATRVIDGLFCVPGLAKVMRQFRKVRSEIGGVHLFQRFANHAMESGALRVGRVFVKSLADQRMRDRQLSRESATTMPTSSASRINSASVPALSG